MYTFIGVIVAMTVEYELVLNTMVDVKPVDLMGFEACTGNIGDKHIVLMKSGIGKVNAAIATSALINQCHPDCIINTGVAGGIDKVLSVGDIVVGEHTCYHDFYVGEAVTPSSVGFDDKIAADSALLKCVTNNVEGRSNVKFGLICTGDQFIDNNDKLMEIKSMRPDGLAVDMESNAISHTCSLHKVPFISLRIISDTPWVDNHTEQYTNFWTEAPHKLFELVNMMIASL